MKIIELHEWISSKDGVCFTIEMSYMIIWNRGSKGITIKKYTKAVGGNQRYDFEHDDEVERLIEVLSANWDHPCFTRTSW